MKNTTGIVLALFFFIGILISANSYSYAANLKPNEIDMEKMSKEIGIPVAEIKYRLGDTAIATVEDAIAVFNMSSANTKERARALEKWIELSTTAKEIRIVWRMVTKGTPLYGKVLRKWIEVVNTATEAHEVWERAPRDSGKKQATFEKLATFYKK